MIPWIRDHLVRIYRVRGGGVYALGYLVTFLYLELRTVVGEFETSESLEQFVVSQALQIVFRFALDSLVNSITAFLWPLTLIEVVGPGIGIALLVVLFVVFERFVRRWLNPYVDALGGDDPESRSND